MAAVDHEYHSVNIISRLRAKKDRGGFNIANRSETAQRNSRAQPFFDELRNEPLHPFRVANRTRRDRVGANPITSPLHRQIPGECVNAGFRCGHMDLQRRAEIMERRADIQNLAAVFPKLSKGSSTNIEGALQVDIDYGSEAIRREVLGRAKKVAGGAINDNIYFAEAFDSRVNRSLYFFRFTHVSGERKSFSA